MCCGESKVGKATFISTIVSQLLSELGRRLSGLSLSKFRRMIYAGVCVLPGQDQFYPRGISGRHSYP